jgi:DNA-binding transcriptional MerR regulator
LGIDEVMARAGVSERLVRHCETRGLVPAAQRADGAGHPYTHEDVCVLRFVRRAHVLGFGMDEVARLLALWLDPHRPSAEVKRIALAQAEALESRIEELLARKRVLERLAKLCLGDHQPACPILDELVELRGFASQAEGEGGTTAA